VGYFQILRRASRLGSARVSCAGFGVAQKHAFV
jgi:hypothetical protein